MARNSDKFANDIASLVVTTFDSRRIRGKPRNRPNGVIEWTVLAGIVAIHAKPESSEYTLDLVALTTGVKPLSDEFIWLSDDVLYHDCHAEILCLRSFNRFIVNECQKSVSAYVEKSPLGHKKRFKLKTGIEFAFYVSELPCSDCAKHLFKSENDPFESEDKFTYLDIGVERARDSYHIKNRVRRSFGARDNSTSSMLSRCQNCPDDLCLTEGKSILNSLSSTYLDKDDFYLNWLVIPEDRSDGQALHRCLSMPGTDCVQPVRCLKTSVHHSWEKVNENQVPSDNCVVYIPSLHIRESVKFSPEEGYLKKRRSWIRHRESLLSGKKLTKQIEKMLDSPQHYIQFDRNMKLRPRHLLRPQLPQKTTGYKRLSCTDLIHKGNILKWC